MDNLIGVGDFRDREALTRPMYELGGKRADLFRAPRSRA
ncbi:hypothetical protein J2785_007333 [Burkholderia ambifaria]|nr:hypothetical protein [Burkholderia ambifaria]